MTRTGKLVLGGFLLLLGIGFYGWITQEAPPEVQKEPAQSSQVFVGMEVYSSGLAPIGRVVRVLRDNADAAVGVEIKGNFFARGVRQIAIEQFYLVARYMVVKMHRHEFRALPRIDKKR